MRPKNWEQNFCDMQEFADFVCHIAGIDEIPIKLTNASTYGGKAFRKKRYIAIPVRELEDFSGAEHWRKHVIIHEICHFLNWENGGRGHDSQFLRIERDLHAQFGMKGLYSKVYIHTLMDMSGNVLWTKKYYKEDRYAAQAKS